MINDSSLTCKRAMAATEKATAFLSGKQNGKQKWLGVKVENAVGKSKNGVDCFAFNTVK
jgi:hypothetical protein